MATITLGGNEVHTSGELKAVGETVQFKLVNTALEEVTLDNYAGKKKVLNIFPSIDTGVCATSVRTFNEKAASAENTVVLNISADLPFAQKRFCAAEGIENAESLSTFRSNFAQDFGLEMTDGKLVGLCARVVMVLDADNKVTYTELVPEIAQEPNYDAALAAL